MKCAKLTEIVGRHLEELRCALQLEAPGLVFVGLVVADAECDTRPGQMHVETAVTHRPDHDRGLGLVVMELALEQMKKGRTH